MKKILFYGMPWQDLAVCRAIADEMGIEVGVIDDSCLEHTLQECMDKECLFEGSTNAFDSCYLFFQEIELEEFKTYIQRIEEVIEELEIIKVARTEHNQSWTLSSIMEETSQEHHLFQKVMLLQQLVGACNGIDFQSMEEAQADAFKSSLLDAYVLLQSQDYDLDSIDASLHELAEHLKNYQKLLH